MQSMRRALPRLCYHSSLNVHQSNAHRRAHCATWGASTRHNGSAHHAHDKERQRLSGVRCTSLRRRQRGSAHRAHDQERPRRWTSSPCKHALERHCQALERHANWYLQFAFYHHELNVLDLVSKCAFADFEAKLAHLLALIGHLDKLCATVRAEASWRSRARARSPLRRHDD